MPRQESILFDKLTSSGFQEPVDNALVSIDTDNNSAVSIFTNAQLESASGMKKKINFNSKGTFKAKWFDEECFQLKREVKRILRRYRRKRKLCDFQSYLKICKKIIKAKSKQRSVCSNNVKLIPCWVQLETPKILGEKSVRAKEK